MDGVKHASAYEVLTYRAPPGAVWYHFLHGNVPGHQIDFMYQPDLPEGPLTRQHFSHLSRLVKYIEPRHGSAYAFAIGNLSRDDTQYEPGRGGLALLFGLRIKGAKDHAGRQDPPFCHSIVAIARSLDEDTIFNVATAFHKKLLPDARGQAEGGGFYHTYVRCGQNLSARSSLLRRYISGFQDLPKPKPDFRGLVWSMERNTPPKRVEIVIPDETSFEQIVRCAARIASVLVESDIRWTSITSGREDDVGGGVTVRFVPAEEATQEGEGVLVIKLEDVPLGLDDVARELFNAVRVQASATPELRQGWRQLTAQNVEDAKAEAGVVAEVKPKADADEPKSRKVMGMLVGSGVAVVIALVIVAAALEGGGSNVEGRVNAGETQREAPKVQTVETAETVDAPKRQEPLASTTSVLTTPSASASVTTKAAGRGSKTKPPKPKDIDYFKVVDNAIGRGKP